MKFFNSVGPKSKKKCLKNKVLKLLIYNLEVLKIICFVTVTYERFLSS